MSASRASLRVASYVLRVGRWYLCAGAVVVALVVAAQTAGLLVRCETFGLDATPSFGDIAAFALSGTVAPDLSALMVAPARVLELPFGWIVLAITPLALTALLVPAGAGDLVVAAAGSRVACLLGQCLAALVECLTCWASVLVTCVIAAALLGAPLSLDVSSWLVGVIGIAAESAASPPYEVAPALAALVSVSCGLSVAQVGLTSACGGRAALLVVMVPVVAAPFAATPVLLGNLMMLARSTTLVAVSTYATVGAGGPFSPSLAVPAFFVLTAVGVVSSCLSLFRPHR